MELVTIRVIQRELICNTCETEFFGYSEVRDTGALLYECNECTAIFSLGRDDERPMEDLVKDRFCPDCNAPLAECLEEKSQAGICPMCEDRDYHGGGDPKEVDLETFAL